MTSTQPEEPNAGDQHRPPTPMKTERVYTGDSSKITGEEYGQARNPEKASEEGQQGRSGPQQG
jgi:hypothetical protein